MKLRITSILLLVLLPASLGGCIRRPSYNTEASQSTATNPPPVSSSPKQCALPFSGAYVNDFAQVINAESKNALEQKLKALKSVGSIDFAIVTVKTTADQSIFDYSLALARCWELGGSNADRAGMLLLLAVDDRKWHLQISRSIEKDLSNEEIQDAGRLMTPHVRTGDYSQGLQKFVDGIIETLGPRRKFSTNLNQ